MSGKNDVLALIGGEQEHQAVKTDGICTCLTSSMGTGGGYIPMVVMEEAKIEEDKTTDLKRIGNIYGDDVGTGRAGNIWDKNGLSPTLKTMGGGNQQPMIIDDMTELKTKPEERFFNQALETLAENNCEPGDTINAFNKTVDKSGVCPTLTTRPEGFKTAILPVVETKPECINLYDEQGKETSLQDRVYKTDKISPAITTSFRPSYAVEHNETDSEKIKIKQATKQGFIECKAGGVADFSYPNSKLRRGRVQGGGDVSPTLTSSNMGVCKVESRYRIRKLTPCECWRLMGFTDEDFEKAAKVNSNTQLYKEAGNSIVKDVLMAIFRQMID